MEKIPHDDEIHHLPFDDLNKINKQAKQHSLTIYYHKDKLFKSKQYGPEIYVRYKNGNLLACSNPGRLINLPAGVNKSKGCKYKMCDIFDTSCKSSCDQRLNWKDLEVQYGVGINIWEKKNLALNKSSVKLIRKSKFKPAIHLHYDKIFHKLFLITNIKVYFRSHMKLIN